MFVLLFTGYHEGIHLDYEFICVSSHKCQNMPKIYDFILFFSLSLKYLLYWKYSLCLFVLVKTCLGKHASLKLQIWAYQIQGEKQSFNSQTYQYPFFPFIPAVISLASSRFWTFSLFYFIIAFCFVSKLSIISSSYLALLH